MPKARVCKAKKIVFDDEKNSVYICVKLRSEWSKSEIRELKKFIDLSVAQFLNPKKQIEVSPPQE